MRVAIDVGPVKTGHAVRGVGVYTRNLAEGLKSLRAKELEVVEFSGGRMPWRVDLVHYPYFDLFWHTLPLMKRRPTVVTIHDVIPLVFPEHFPPGKKGNLNLKLQKLALRSVKAVVTDSECSKRDIHKYLGVPLAKIHRVYLAGQPSLRQGYGEAKQVKKKYKLPECFVLYVGDVNYNKNLPALVQAMARIKNQELRIKGKTNAGLEDLKLVVVGKQAVAKDYDRDHVENQALVEFQRMCEEEDFVMRLGYVPVEDLTVIYRLASVYCQSSYYEGFGVPVLEAMAAGCPVVSTKGGSLVEIGGEAAIYTDTKSESIAKGISLVLGLSKVQRKRLVQEGEKRARKFSWEKVAEETFQIYERVVGGGD